MNTLKIGDLYKVHNVLGVTSVSGAGWLVLSPKDLVLVVDFKEHSNSKYHMVEILYDGKIWGSSLKLNEISYYFKRVSNHGNRNRT